MSKGTKIELTSHELDDIIVALALGDKDARLKALHERLRPFRISYPGTGYLVMFNDPWKRPRLEDMG